MFEKAVPNTACVYSWRVNPWREGRCSALTVDPLPPRSRKMRGSTANSSGGRRILYRRIRCWRISRNSFRRITNTLRIRGSVLSFCLVADNRSVRLMLHQFQVHLFEGMGGRFHRADGCACLHERAHQVRILVIRMREADGEDALGSRRLLDKGQSADGFEPARGVPDDAHLGARSKQAGA